MRHIIVVISLFIAISTMAPAQDAMTNSSVKDMVKAGLSEQVIVEAVNQHPGQYTLSPDDLISLRAAGVPDGVLSAMQNRMKAAHQPGTTGLTTGVPPMVRASSTHEASFHKSKLADVKGKDANADLIFSDAKRSIIVNVAGGNTVATIPYAVIDKLSYEYTKHHRIKQGAIVMVASLGAGAIVMLTKSRSHWFTIEYHEENVPKSLVLRLDKSEYKQVLKVATAATGKDIASQNF